LEDVATWAANIRLGREWKGGSLDSARSFSDGTRADMDQRDLLRRSVFYLASLNVYGLRYSCDLIMDEVTGDT
jgi:hypothetical protein